MKPLILLSILILLTQGVCIAECTSGKEVRMQIKVPAELWTNPNNQRSPLADKFFKDNGYYGWACSPEIEDGFRECGVYKCEE